MKYLKKFQQQSEYAGYDAKNGEDYKYSTTAYIEEGEDVKYNDYEKMPLTLQIIGSKEQTEGNIYLNFDGEDSSYVVTLLYRVNEGEWEEGTFGETEIAVEAGDIVQFKCDEETVYGEGYESSFSNYNYFYCDINFNIFGNLNSLNNFNDEISDCQYSFLFFSNDRLLSAKHLVLPSIELKNFCYYCMFEDCTSLIQAPELPAIMLADWCYYGMFHDCTSLTQAPALPAMSLGTNCYSSMFHDCTSLTQAPALPATTLANGCYEDMFFGCTGLTSAPELPATGLTIGCYGGMFLGCTSLNYIKCLATDISANYCTNNWVTNVASAGTFVKAASMSGWSIGRDGIPNGWTVVDAQ